MSDIINIGDHLAFACECGSVTFNLLKSGSIECDGCQQKQQNLNWGEIMDLKEQGRIDATATEKPKIDESDVIGARRLIFAAITKNGGYGYMSTITKFINGIYSQDVISLALNGLLKDGVIRQKKTQ